MGIKLNQLDAQTVLNNDDILHLRTSGGLDKKITVENAKKILWGPARDVTIEDTVSENDIIVSKWDPDKFYKAGTFSYEVSSKVLFTNSRAAGNQGSITLSENLLISFFQDSGDVYAVAISIDVDGTPSLGSAVLMADSATYSPVYVKGCRINDTCFVLIWSNSSATSLMGVIGTVSGTTITGGTPFTIKSSTSPAPANGPWPVNKKDDYFIFCYENSSNSLGYGSVWLVNDTARTAAQQGTEYNWGTSTILFWAPAIIDDGVIMFLVVQSATALVMKSFTVSDAGAWSTELVSGTWAFGGDLEIIHGWSYERKMAAFNFIEKINNFINHFIFFGHELNHSKLIKHHQVQFSSTYIYYGERNGGSQLSKGKLHIGEIDQNEDYWGVMVYAPSKKHNYKSEPVLVFHDIPYTNADIAPQVEELSDSKCVIIYKLSTDTYYAVRTFMWKSKVIGFATENRAAGQSQEVQFSGIKDGFSSLVPGKDYYLSSSGILQIDEGLVKIGTAVSTTELLIDIEEPW